MAWFVLSFKEKALISYSIRKNYYYFYSISPSTILGDFFTKSINLSRDGISLIMGIFYTRIPNSPITFMFAYLVTTFIRWFNKSYNIRKHCCYYLHLINRSKLTLLVRNIAPTFKLLGKNVVIGKEHVPLIEVPAGNLF